jgi:sulfide dehydrogenase [flavocytochrome c] flavoprotein chain
VIPPQYAAAIARDAGLANDTGWVPVDQHTFAAQAATHVHVVGDAMIATPLPKSGFIANSTAKTAVAAALADLTGREGPENSVYFNTCYSHAGENYAFSVAAVFRPTAEGFADTPESGGVSPRGPLSEYGRNRRLEARYADAWYDSITQDMFG